MPREELEEKNIRTMAKPALSVTQEGGMWMDGEKLQLLEMFCNLNENIVLILNVILI